MKTYKVICKIIRENSWTYDTLKVKSNKQDYSDIQNDIIDKIDLSPSKYGLTIHDKLIIGMIRDSKDNVIFEEEMECQ